MKRITLALFAALLLSFLSPSSNAWPRGCTGAKDCRVCKNCKYCKHCAKEGGTCGVCKSEEAPKPKPKPVKKK